MPCIDLGAVVFSTLPPLPERPSLSSPSVAPDGFVADAAIEAWSRRALAHRSGGTLWLAAEGAWSQPIDVVDAVRILGRRDGESDPFGWTGRVFALRELLRLGATIAPDGCKLGAATYDLEFGVQVTAGPDLPPRDRARR